MVKGHHNINYVVPLGLGLAVLLGVPPFARGKVRVPLETVEVVPRIWPREAEVLRVVSRHIRQVPRCLADFGEWSLHSYRKGRVLAELHPGGDVGERVMRAFAEFFAATASIPVDELPARPKGWPEDGDSEGFLHWLVDFTEERVHQAHRDRFGSLFDSVLIPDNAMATFRKAHGGLTPRPFRLLHTDVHRSNVVVRRGRLTVIDWELAMYGDPLHDLATHLVRMRYGKRAQERMTDLWGEAMVRAGHGVLTAGLDDLAIYLAFEHAQSVFPDVMRAALSVPEEPEADDFRRAAARIRAAIRTAREPLQLIEVPDERRVIEALREWHARNILSSSPG
ncbi:aminoglycoside phosphotransferase family protein [Streptomyces sp. NPDC051104]|uniref:aminoglycoside phosphotransferase family protein n=1 Tax=Streptomyces sp. NPDC051104 TaxID=3155044 RepID=UPI003421560E